MQIHVSIKFGFLDIIRKLIEPVTTGKINLLLHSTERYSSLTLITSEHLCQEQALYLHEELHAK